MDIDFLSGKNAYRQQQLSIKKELIARACGLKQGQRPVIYDVTGGLGRDSFMLARLGCQVTCIERHPEIAAALDDAFLRAKQAFPDLDVTFIHADAIDILKALAKANYPDVIYLDPMFPERKKSALVKQEMRELRELVGDDDDAVDLFELALTKAKQRVVVKRSRLAPQLSDAAPDIQYKGQSSRFDVYLIQS